MNSDTLILIAVGIIINTFLGMIMITLVDDKNQSIKKWVMSAQLWVIVIQFWLIIVILALKKTEDE